MKLIKEKQEGDSIGRIIILELTERDSSAFEDILSFLSRHPDLEKWELRDEPILSLPGLEIKATPHISIARQQKKKKALSGEPSAKSNDQYYVHRAH